MKFNLIYQFFLLWSVREPPTMSSIINLKLLNCGQKIVLMIKLLSNILAKNKSIYSTSLFIKSFSESIIDKDKKQKGKKNN